MRTLSTATLALALAASAALPNPAFAVEPEKDSTAEPPLISPHADLPDFQINWTCCDDATLPEVSADNEPVIAEPGLPISR